MKGLDFLWGHERGVGGVEDRKEGVARLEDGLYFFVEVFGVCDVRGNGGAQEDELLVFFRVIVVDGGLVSGG